MTSPQSAIEAAEQAVTEELDAIVSDLRSLAERAKAARDDAKRLTNLKARGEAIEKEIREAAGRVEQNGEKESRPAEVSNGEFVDEELAEEARKRRAS